jgi:hypothetical protein
MLLFQTLEDILLTIRDAYIYHTMERLDQGSLHPSIKHPKAYMSWFNPRLLHHRWALHQKAIQKDYDYHLSVLIRFNTY